MCPLKVPVTGHGFYRRGRGGGVPTPLSPCVLGVVLVPARLKTGRATDLPPTVCYRHMPTSKSRSNKHAPEELQLTEEHGRSTEGSALFVNVSGCLWRRLSLVPSQGGSWRAFNFPSDVGGRPGWPVLTRLSFPRKFASLRRCEFTWQSVGVCLRPVHLSQPTKRSNRACGLETPTRSFHMFSLAQQN